MLNNYIWKLYKQADGTQVINMFRKNLTGKLEQTYADEIKRFQLRYAIEDVAADNYEQLLELTKVIKAKTKVVFLPGAVRGTASTKEIFRAIDSVMHDAIQCWVEEDGREQDVLAGFIDSLSYTSTNWAILYPGVPVEVIPDFRECDFGLFENKNYAELNGRQDYQAWIDSGGELPFPGGESRMEFAARCREAFLELRERKPDGDCALIVHGGTIMAIMEAWSQPPAGYYDFQVQNGQGYILEEDGARFPIG